MFFRLGIPFRTGDALWGGITHTSGQVSKYVASVFVGSRFLSSAGVGRSCALPTRVPSPSPTLDKTLAPMGPGVLSSIGTGVWRESSGAFPESNTVLDICGQCFGGLQSSIMGSQHPSPSVGNL